MFRISPAQPALHLSATTSLPSSKSVCHRLVRLLDDERSRQSFHDREFLNRPFLQLSGTGMPGWYYTPDFADGSRLTLDMSIAGQITVTAYGPGMASERAILTPVHPLWEVISNAPAQAKFIREWRDWAAMPAPGEKRKEALRRVTDCVVKSATYLDLNRLGLTSLPVLPDSLKKLSVSDNHLAALPDLPDSLTTLNIGKNKLLYLPALPGLLQSLDASNNKLTALPDLPGSLTELKASRNQLTALPDLSNSLTELDASNNQLTTLPALPASITELNVGGNQLTALPELPDLLTTLYANDNQLTALPDLPTILKCLYVRHNQLTTLPALPNSLTTLHASNNQLTALPALPNSLTKLDASSNQLTAMPDFPGSLTDLKASSNQLIALPDLPNSLTELNINDNRLTTLPALPTMLKCLSVWHNQLSTLPALPNSLTTLYASNNQLTTLPDLPGSLIRLDISDNFLITLPALPDSLVVLNIARNWLGILPALPALLEGHYIGFRNQRDLRQLFSLSNCITRWYPEQRHESVCFTWSPLTMEENVTPFKKFLNKLNENICAASPVFRENVAAWLDELLTTPELRTLSFAMAQEASTSCTDRAALGWNNMQVVRLLFHASRNEQTTAGEFITLARQIFRLRQLERIAGDKVRSLLTASSATSTRIYEIEVYLAYQTRLKEALRLPDILTSAMNFGALAGVTEEDISIALEAVQHAEEHGFRSWLNNWEPCQQFLLKRMTADEQDALTEQRIAVFEEQLQHFRQEFSDAGSGTDVDRVLGVRATEATNNIIFGPLTGKML